MLGRSALAARSWGRKAMRPRMAGGELCVISPSVANAMNVPAMLVKSTMPDRSGMVLRPSGTTDMAMKPTDTRLMAIRYHFFRDSV